MKDYLKARRKAVASALPPLIAALILWSLTGNLNAPELTLGLVAVLNAVLVEQTPNVPEER